MGPLLSSFSRLSLFPLKLTAPKILLCHCSSLFEGADGLSIQIPISFFSHFFGKTEKGERAEKREKVKKKSLSVSKSYTIVFTHLGADR